MLRTSGRVGMRSVPLLTGGLFSWREKTDILARDLIKTNIVRRTLRDAFYMFIDSWGEIKRAHKSYGDFHDYIRMRAKGKDLPEDRMDSLDLEIMRKQLSLYQQAKSPLTAFDLRWFYWIYAAWFLVLLHGGYQAYQRKQAYQEMLGGETEDMTIEERRKKFGRAYIEDVRRAP